MSAPIPLLRRAILHISGPDAAGFLEGLLTNSVLDLKDNDLCHSALLTPQGKLLAELFVLYRDRDFWLDVPKTQADRLLKTFTLYRLRSRLEMTLRPDLGVWIDCERGSPDPRSLQLASRFIKAVSEGPAPDKNALATYDLGRIRACAPESDCDFAPNQVFPADINMDVLAGIDFSKGCFVGQEVVSRMKRRGTARRRSISVHVSGGAPPVGTPVTESTRTIGKVTSRLGEYALARIRIDKMPNGPDTELYIADKRAVCDIPPVLTKAFFGSGSDESA